MNQKSIDQILLIENVLNFVKSTIYDNPFYCVCPTTRFPRDTWEELTAIGYNTELNRKSLFENGFFVLDRELLALKGQQDLFEPLQFSEQHLIVDKDYGLIILPKNPFGKKNFYLGMAELERYGLHYPPLKQSLSNLFSIGAMRAHSILNNKLDYTPIDIELSSRVELDHLCNRITSALIHAKSRFKIFFRGQTKEHCLPKIQKELLNDAPWRSINDPSLVPSLLRLSKFYHDDLLDYESKLTEVLLYERELMNFLDIKLYNQRGSTEKIKQYFEDSVWEDSNVAFSFAHQNENGEILKVHDYNPVYRALQISLFLQHYGIPTNILDVTKSIDVALFFAQNKLTENRYEPDQSNNGIVYIYLLDPKTDRFIDSEQLLEEFDVKRPIRQQCGVIAGASFSCQNYYSRFISIRVKIRSHIQYDCKLTSDYLFPSDSEDSVLKFLKDLRDENKLKIAPIG